MAADHRPEQARMERLGLGIGWRSEIDLTVERLAGVELRRGHRREHPSHVPAHVAAGAARSAALPVIPHGVSLGVGGAEPPSAATLAHLAACAQALDAPLVSEHLAFVRAGGVEAGHLLPVPRTRDALKVVAQNVRQAQDALPVPLALENVAAIFGWPEDELDRRAVPRRAGRAHRRAPAHRRRQPLHQPGATSGCRRSRRWTTCRCRSSRTCTSPAGRSTAASGTTRTPPRCPSPSSTSSRPCAPAPTRQGSCWSGTTDYPSDDALAAELSRIRAATTRPLA